MTFLDYLMFNFSVASGILCLVAVVISATETMSFIDTGYYKKAIVAGLFLFLAISTACVVFAYGCATGNRIFKKNRGQRVTGNEQSRNHFGTYLRSYRMGIGYTLREFARELGMSPTTLSSMELGQRPCPRSFNWNKAAELLGIKKGTPDGDVFFAFKFALGLDADLMSAAKDLLEELEWMLEKATQAGWPTDLLKPAQAAIAKAKGVTQ